MFLSAFLPSVSLLICFNFDAGILTMHDGKGKKDRTVPIPQVLVPELKRQLRKVAAIHEADLQTKYAGAFLPDQLERKYKAELSSSPAQTKLMPFGYKAELSSSPAQTKLMPFGYKAELSSSPAQTKLIPFGYKNAAKEFIWQCFFPGAIVNFTAETAGQ